MDLFKRKNVKNYLEKLSIKPIYNIKVKNIEVEMNNIYENRHKYNLDWAYEYSHKLVNEFLDENIFLKMKKKVISNTEEEYRNKIIRRVNTLEGFVNKKLI